jgi:hypothetical protein
MGVDDGRESSGVERNDDALTAKGAIKEMNKIDKRKMLGRILCLWLAVLVIIFSSSIHLLHRICKPSV